MLNAFSILIKSLENVLKWETVKETGITRLRV